MHFKRRRAAVIISCLALAIVCTAPALLHGNNWNMATRFTVNRAFEVPGLVLQANTRYVIRVMETFSTQNVVQIWNDNQTRMLTMFTAISDLRMDPTGHTMFTFIETEPGYPVPIKEWFYPGDLRGLEFVYPNDQALKISKYAKEPVHAINDLDDAAATKVAAIMPLGPEFPQATTATTATAADTTKAETAPVAESKPTVSENSEPPSREEAAPIVPSDTESNISNTNAEPEVQAEPAEAPVYSEEPKPTEDPQKPAENRELPRTAGELALFALIGALCLGAGVGMRVLSPKS